MNFNQITNDKKIIKELNDKINITYNHYPEYNKGPGDTGIVIKKVLDTVSENYSVFSGDDDYFLPSSLDNANHTKSPYVLFCGGSTTESSFVPEGLRVPDVYAKVSKRRSVNASKSAKTLSGCIQTIEFIFENSEKQPDNIVIATNHNTLSTKSSS